MYQCIAATCINSALMVAVVSTRFLEPFQEAIAGTLRWISVLDDPIADCSNLLLTLRRVIATLTLVCLGFFHGCNRHSATNEGDATAATAVQDVVGTAESALRKVGWTSDAARAVANQNTRYFQILIEEDRTQFEKTIAILGRLAKHPEAQSALIKKPELAGLLAASLEVIPDGPRKILATVPADGHEDQEAVLELYGLFAAPVDSIALAESLGRDYSIIIRLSKQGAFDGIRWFSTLPTQPDAAEEYRQWLKIVFEAALNDSDEDELDRAQTFLVIHAPVIRERLESDDRFRLEFLTTYWPHFARILIKQTDDLAWGTYVSDARVWDFYQRYGEKGRKLFESRGPLAIDLMYADEYRSCQEQVFSTLEFANELVITSLYDDELRKQPLFIELIRRDLPGGTLAKALHLLARSGAQKPQLLEQWNSLDRSALIEDLGPPPEGPQTWLPGYSLYQLGRKKLQGREVTGMDLVFAAVDTVEIVLMAKGASKGLKVLQKGLGEQLVKRGVRQGAEQIASRSSRELFPWVLREGYRLSRTLGKSTGDKLSIDITDAIRFAFERSGLGNTTFKRLTGLEARVFMRSDRRVAVDVLGLTKSDHLVGRALRETAVNAGFDLSLATEPGQAAVKATVPITVQAADKAGAQLRAWKEHLSIWWLAANDGALVVKTSP